MRAHLRAGVAIFDEGRYHAAHDAWEESWLDLEAGTDDERLLHGLIQYTAVVHHAREGNWSGAVGLAESAGEYLAPLPETYRGVDLGPIRPFLAHVAADEERIESEDAPALTHEGVVLGYDDLDFEATAIAAHVLADADGYDEPAVDAAVEFARAEVTDPDREGGTFAGLVFAFVRERDRRGVVAQRLVAHVERRQRREGDVDGLFD